MATNTDQQPYFSVQFQRTRLGFTTFDYIRSQEQHVFWLNNEKAVLVATEDQSTFIGNGSSGTYSVMIFDACPDFDIPEGRPEHIAGYVDYNNGERALFGGLKKYSSGLLEVSKSKDRLDLPRKISRSGEQAAGTVCLPIVEFGENFPPFNFGSSVELTYGATNTLTMFDVLDQDGNRLPGTVNRPRLGVVGPGNQRTWEIIWEENGTTSWKILITVLGKTLVGYLEPPSELQRPGIFAAEGQGAGNGD